MGGSVGVVCVFMGERVCPWHGEAQQVFRGSTVHTNPIEGFGGVTKKMFRARWQAFQGKRIQEKLQGCVFLWLATRLPEMSAECPVMKRLGVPNPYFVLRGREGGRK